MTCKASEIYEQLQTLRAQLDQLTGEGRVVMARDSMNRNYPEVAGATAAALAGLDQAINATVWMETLPTLSGDYPPLKD